MEGIDDRELEIPKYSPVCSYCKHLEDGLKRRCTAFDSEFGIPLTIWNGENNHRQPFPGDGGIQFEKP